MGAKLDRMKAAAANKDKRKDGRPRLKDKFMPGKLVGNSPPKPTPTRAEKLKGRDKEMEDRGRWPVRTRIVTDMVESHRWNVSVMIPEPNQKPSESAFAWYWEVSGQGLHELLTTAYRAWVEAGKPGA